MEGENTEETRTESAQQERVQEVRTTSGAVEAVSQKGNRYGIRVGDAWYGGFGACPVAKGQVCVIDYVMRERWRNILRVREVGEGVADSLSSLSSREEVMASRAMPAAVMNYQTESGWRQAAVSDDEEKLIQEAVRFRNRAVMDECLVDAEVVLAVRGTQRLSTPKNILELAMFLAERRIVHVSRVFDEFLRAKIAAERLGRRAPEGESPCALGGDTGGGYA